MMSKKDMKKVLTGLMVMMLSVMMVGHYIQIKKVEKEERIHKKIVEMRLDINSIKEDIKAEKDKIERENKLNEEYRQYLVDGWNTPEWKEITKVRAIKQQYGLQYRGYQKITFELSFYSDLNCENGYGNLTASGKRLQAGMIANNFLPFGTKIYLDGHGMKTVEDRGSERYFYNVSKIDVLVPRMYGESEGAYLRRVNNMGRQRVTGYLFE